MAGILTISAVLDGLRWFQCASGGRDAAYGRIPELWCVGIRDRVLMLFLRCDEVGCVVGRWGLTEPISKSALGSVYCF